MNTQLTTQQAQFLKTFLSRKINVLETAIRSTGNNITALYEYCDKDKPTTCFYFNDMNRAKERNRAYKQERNKLAEIQKVVKKLAK